MKIQVARCPHCGAGTAVQVPQLREGVKDDWSLRCNGCGKTSHAREWLKDLDGDNEAG